MDESKMGLNQPVFAESVPGNTYLERDSTGMGSRVASIRQNCLVCRFCGGVDLATSSDPVEPVFLTVDGKPVLVRHSTCCACKEARKKNNAR